MLGHGWYARSKKFDKLSHALQLVYLTQILRVDFTTDVLALRKGAPSDFDSYLEFFKMKMIYPLMASVFKSIQNYPR